MTANTRFWLRIVDKIGNREDENGEASSNQDENDAILSGSAIVKLESTS